MIEKIRESFNQRNTIFNKAILIFVLVSFISFLLTGFLMSNFMVNYFVNENVKQMSQTASLINKMIDSWALEFDEDSLVSINVDYIRGIANLYGTMTDSHIYIVEVSDENMGKVVVSVPAIGTTSIRDNLILRNSNYYFSEEQYENVLNSGTTIINQGDYYGLYKGTEAKWVTIAQKLEVAIDNEATLVGIIVISRPMSNVNIMRNTVTKYFLLAMCIALLLSIILAAFFTKRITEPIEKLRVAANKVSKGEFRSKIEYDAHDDMGDLINSFNAMTRSLENQDSAKNDFIANVSHELRTPITTIGGFIDGILDGTVPEDKIEYYLKIVKDEVARMNNLVNDQLQIARLQQGVLDLKFKSFDINEMIRREIIKNEKAIEDKHLEIGVEFENEQQFVYAEENSINRVLINLLNNAIKFTPENGKVTLGTLRRKGDVEIYVKDSGVGIEPGELDRIFERYFKSDRSRGIDKTGTGLGLSICKNIINAHNHNIKAENNTDGKGARIVFWLSAI